eukprot:GHVR01148029.1.p1 GENE.GHVR01148029.1~~GHVR01148029.1.p1  ORF type:complete len:528 (+),score=102.29 GHVR01148029.1:170-1753(+)
MSIAEMPPMPDPKGDRVVTTVEAPPTLPLTDEMLFPEGEKRKIDVKVLQHHLSRQGKLTHTQILTIVRRATDVVQAESNLVKIKDPVTIVGDIHGQYYDLVRLLELGGDPSTSQYAFLGDYVDRGSYSVEVCLLLMSLKLSSPRRIWLLRGNHECRQMTAFFNFKDECEHKYDMNVYYAFMEFFDCLPLAALINGRFLAVHGGISPELLSVPDIGGINRFQEPPKSGLFCDLLWSDPVDEEKEEMIQQALIEPYLANDARGCSYFFGYQAAKTFLDNNNLLSIIRAHEAQIEGYRMHATNAKSGFPTVLTIFSAPNYCDCYNNKGAVLKFENNTLNIQQFNYSPHPYHLPNFMDVFMWSLPFVSEKVVEMLYHLMKPASDDEGNDDDYQLPPQVEQEIRNMFAEGNSGDVLSLQTTKSDLDMSSSERLEKLRKRKEELKSKVKTVSRMMRMFKTLRQENELIVQLKGQTPGHRIPMGALVEGRRGLQSELDTFCCLKQVDMKNEGRPENFEAPTTPKHSRCSLSKDR